MAIKLPDGKVARTLPEQVKKNMEDITAIDSEITVIKESISTAYKIQGSATVADLNGETIEESMNGYVYNMTDAGSLNNADGTTTSVQIGDNVVLVWNEGDYFWDRLSGLVDTSDLVTLSTDQTITGEKKIANNKQLRFGAAADTNYFYVMGDGNRMKIGAVGLATSLVLGSYLTSFLPESNNSQSLGSSTYQWKDLYLSGSAVFGNSGGNDVVWKFENGYLSAAYGASNALMIGNNIVYTRAVVPVINNYYELGTITNMWKNFFLTGSIQDGTNSVSVAQLVKKTQLYKHAVLINGLLNAEIILNSNTSLAGLVGTVLAGKQVISAYLTGLFMLYVDSSFNLGHFASGAWTTDINATDTITTDTVSEY